MDLKMTVNFSGTLQQCVDMAAFYITNGYTIHHEVSKRQWPLFWTKRYTIYMHRPPTEQEVDAVVTSLLSSRIDNQHLCLKAKLQKAIESENYELAAILRDKINNKP